MLGGALGQVAPDRFSTVLVRGTLRASVMFFVTFLGSKKYLIVLF